MWMLSEISFYTCYIKANGFLIRKIIYLSNNLNLKFILHIFASIINLYTTESI